MTERTNIRKMYDQLLPQVSASYFELFYYSITMSVCLYFLFIILRDLKKTYATYYDDINIPWDEIKNGFKPIQNIFDNKGGKDDYSYDNENDGENIMDIIRESLDKNHTELSDTFESILNFKKDHNIKHELNTEIDHTTFGKISDNYYFEPKRNTSFFQMLFQKPKHYPLVNNTPNL